MKYLPYLLLVLIPFLIGGACMWIEHSYTIVSAIVTPHKNKNHYNFINVEVTYRNGKKCRFAGNGTVWHFYPFMERCGKSQETELCNILTYYIEHGNPYPTSHEKNNCL